MKAQLVTLLFAMILMSALSVFAQNNSRTDEDNTEFIEPAKPQTGALPVVGKGSPAIPTARRGEQGGPSDQDPDLKTGEEFSGTQTKIGKDLSS